MRASSSKPLRLVLLGAPGAGKGTQSQLLCARLEIPHISTGDLLREAQQKGTPLGRLATEYADRGELLPDHVMSAVVSEYLRPVASGPGFALDGYPRTLAQAETLSGILSALQIELTAVVYYDCPEEELVRRLSGRLVCENCGRIYHFPDPEMAEGVQCGACGGSLKRREDDSPEAVRRRLALYAERTRPLVGYYETRGILHRITAIGPVEEIFRRTMQSLDLES